ncbi:hypothetical protein T484DRAFT_2659462, partial [Baffinella frigidus]
GANAVEPAPRDVPPETRRPRSIPQEIPRPPPRLEFSLLQLQPPPRAPAPPHRPRSVRPNAPPVRASRLSPQPRCPRHPIFTVHRLAPPPPGRRRPCRAPAAGGGEGGGWGGCGDGGGGRSRGGTGVGVWGGRAGELGGAGEGDAGCGGVRGEARGCVPVRGEHLRHGCAG